ncbi:MAG: hypothetical protein ABJD11_10200 [Gemmatimonadota bacterium]
MTLAGALFGALLSCSRDRLTFPAGPNGTGPVTTIDQPGSDTTVSAGPEFFVTGRTIDLDGIDTVYVESTGGVSNFAPSVVGSDSFRFGFPFTTLGLSGDTINIRIFGVDRLGNRGDTASRQLVIQ